MNDESILPVVEWKYRGRGPRCVCGPVSIVKEGARLQVKEKDGSFSVVKVLRIGRPYGNSHVEGLWVYGYLDPAPRKERPFRSGPKKAFTERHRPPLCPCCQERAATTYVMDCDGIVAAVCHTCASQDVMERCFEDVSPIIEEL